MNKKKSISYTSGTSSETSETQSVEENPFSSSLAPDTITSPNEAYNSSASKGSKRMKDPNGDKDSDGKRPPWRSVSVSTLPKPDKNALLRAKLLDASRRLRAGKSAVAVQTDIEPTKLMKEVKLGVQTDLILHKEVGILTDGSYIKRKGDGIGDYILTYSISQMTDPVIVADKSSQTLLPKVQGDSFIAAYNECNENANLDGIPQSNEFSAVERKLLEQICKIREITKSQGQTHDGSRVREAAASMQRLRPSLLQPTLASWHFEYDQVIDNFHPYAIMPRYPWNYLRALAPTTSNFFYEIRDIDFKLLLLAIDELIAESNNLLDTMLMITTQKIKDIPMEEPVPFKPKEVVLPSDYWLPIIEQQEKVIQELLKPSNNSNDNQ